MQQRWKNNTLSDKDGAFLEVWTEAHSITLLRAPEHGKVKVNAPGYTNSKYVADKDFVGLDQLELLVEGKDLKGASIKIKLIYSLKILSNDDWSKGSKGEGFGKKLCPKNSWMISTGSASLNPYIGTDALTFEKSSLISSVISQWSMEPTSFGDKADKGVRAL